MMKYIFSVLIASFLISCGEDQAKIDEGLIQDYLVENGLTSEVTTEGLHYIIDKPGGDEKPTLSSNVEMCYEGSLLNGNVFDSTYENGSCNESISFLLSNLIESWQIGIPFFGRGGKGTLIVPSNLAYGSRAQGPIPPNSVLIFDIHLIDF